MEKPPVKLKNKILNFLPKAASVSLHFQNIPFSPGRDRIRTHHNNKGFSGPISSSIIPLEARRRSKNFDTQEPTSPKVSCMGQIQHKKKICKNKKKPKPDKPSKPEKTSKPRPVVKVEQRKKPPSGVWKLFGSGRKSDAAINYNAPPQHPSSIESAPGLGKMRKFASSSRDTFAKFDWTTAAQVVPEDNRRDFDDSERDDDVSIPFSAPMVMGGGDVSAMEPRKEINLWKRRTMAQPKPLKLDKIISN